MRKSGRKNGGVDRVGPDRLKGKFKVGGWERGSELSGRWRDGNRGGGGGGESRFG